jgi:predicted DNA-binding ribbon-helix-helix protein
MWEALIEIGLRTKKTINQICTEVHKSSLGADRDEAANGVNFTSELRVFILDYYRAIAR